MDIPEVNAFTSPYLNKILESRGYPVDRLLQDELELPYRFDQIKIKPNDVADAETFNISMDRLYDNFLYLTSNTKLSPPMDNNYLYRLKDSRPDPYHGLPSTISSSGGANGWTNAFLKTAGNGAVDPIDQIITKTTNDKWMSVALYEDNTSLNDTDKQYIRLMLNTFINFVFELSNKKVVLKVKKNKNLRNKPMIELVESILSKILKIVKNKNYDFDSLIANIPVLIGMIISFTSAIPDLTGLEKKNISILVITKLLDNNINGLFELNESQIQTVNFVKQTLPETIDIIIGIAKGKFDLREQLARIFLCCSKNL